jgi:methylthioribose-1-phosphate isomerase
VTVETLRWANGRLELLDQTELPDRIEYVVCHTSSDVVTAIRSMVVRGAPAIGVAAAYGAALAAFAHALNRSRAEFETLLKQSCAELIASRPTAVNLSWAVEEMLEVVASEPSAEPPVIAERILRAAEMLHYRDIAANRAIGTFGASLIPKGARILTHCNAGALATAGYGTALGVVRAAFERDPSVCVLVDETRPLLQGARLTAWELNQEGIPFSLITDNMSGHFMARGDVDVVVVGADRVAANGDVANKIGTYMVAVLAARHNVPFYVACPWSTVDLATPDGSKIVIEERAADEVLGYRKTRWAPINVQVRNPSFDVTPAALVTALITDRGVIRKPSRDSIGFAEASSGVD